MKFSALPLVIVALLSFSFSQAATSSRDAVREAEIEQEVAKLDPALVEPFRQASAAYDAHNYIEVERLLTPIAERFPTFDVVLRRLGGAKALLEKRQEGLALIERAVGEKRSAENLRTLAYVLGFNKNALETEQARALEILLEARGLPRGEDSDILSMLAQLAFQRNRPEVAADAIRTLQKKFPDLMQTHYFAAFQAAQAERWNRAVREIRAAEKAGLESSAVNQFLQSGIQSRATAWFYIGLFLWVVGLWAVGLLTLTFAGFGLSKATLNQVERSDPNVPISPAELRLRQLYRAVLNVAGVYYYISLPIVFVLVLSAAAALVYGFMMIGWLPIKLLLIVGIGAIVTIVAMVRSLFLRVKAEDPGRPLTRTEAPGLWQLTEDVAATLQTRPIDEIRITVGTDLCVYERGSWREKLENRAHRILVIGAAVLDGFKQEDFRSVIAHEYGHFSNRDTAGGDVALRVRSDMIKFYIAMARAGQATWTNIAFHFLRLYNHIFRRISHGATRLQEVLADRVAAQTYGAPAFEGGLRHVIRRSLAFEAHAHAEIENAIKAKRPLQNLYTGELTTGTSVEEKFAEAMNRATTDDDTHPAPKDRFRFIAKVPPSTRLPSPGLVWDLFADREAIVAEMTSTVEKNIAPHRER